MSKSVRKANGMTFLILSCAIISQVSVRIAHTAPDTRQLAASTYTELRAQFDRIEAELMAMQNRRRQNHQGKSHRSGDGFAPFVPTNQKLTEMITNSLKRVTEARNQLDREWKAAGRDIKRQLRALSNGFDNHHQRLVSYFENLLQLYAEDTNWVTKLINGRQQEDKSPLKASYQKELDLKKDPPAVVWQRYNARERVIDQPFIGAYIEAIERLEVIRQRIGRECYYWADRAAQLGNAHEAEHYERYAKISERFLNGGGKLYLEAIDRPRSASSPEPFYRPKKELRASPLDVITPVPVQRPPSNYFSQPDLVLLEVRASGSLDARTLAWTAVIYNAGGADVRPPFNVQFYVRVADPATGNLQTIEIGSVECKQTVSKAWAGPVTVELAVPPESARQLTGARSLRVGVDLDNRVKEIEERWNNSIEITPIPLQ